MCSPRRQLGSRTKPNRDWIFVTFRAMPAARCFIHSRRRILAMNMLAKSKAPKNSIVSTANKVGIVTPARANPILSKHAAVRALLR
jgi:hypothetical protein